MSHNDVYSRAEFIFVNMLFKCDITVTYANIFQ